MSPYEIANKYMNSMSDAIMETIMVNEGTRLGLIKGADFMVDRGRMATYLGAGLKYSDVMCGA